MSMTKKERFLTAVKRKIPDVVPVSPLIHRRFAYKTLGEADWKAVFKVHQMIGSIHFRGPIGVGVKAELPEGWAWKVRLIEQEGVRKVYEHVIETPLGKLIGKYVVGFNPKDPMVGTWKERLVKDAQDWEIYKSYWETWLKSPKEFDTIDAVEAYKYMGEEGVPSVGVGCVFSMLGEARGMYKLLLDLYCNYDTLREVHRVLTEVVKLHVKAFLQTPCEVLFYDICWATGADLSPEHFKELVLPDMAEAVKLVREKPGKFIGFYMLGRIRRHLPAIVELKPDFLETFEPNQGDITLRGAKELYGDKVCIMGNFDCNVLVFGGRKEVERETLRCLKEGMEGGGYVLVTGDEIPANAKLENLLTLVRTVEKYGRYRA